MRHGLANAEAVAQNRGLDKQLIIDADVHHVNVIKDLAPHVDPVWRSAISTAAFTSLKPSAGGNHNVGGRIRIPHPTPDDGGDPPASIRELVRDMGRIGVDCSVAFPGDLLHMGLHPDVRFEAAVALGYARWVTQRVGPYEPRVKMLLYMPWGDPETCLRIIREFGHAPGVVGVVVTSVRMHRLNDDQYLRIYATLQDEGIPLAIHGNTLWTGHPFRLFDRFMGAHSIHFPLFNSIHVANLVLGGIPERFPDLRIIVYEQGAAVIPMLMARLDSAFLMRPSEAPLLRRRPSEYMRTFFWTIQPVEHPERINQLEAIFDAIGRQQILYASDYPHWDWDMPTAIVDLPFLSETEKRDILAHNTLRAFQFQPPGGHQLALDRDGAGTVRR